MNPTRLEVTSWTETSLATTQEQYWLGLGGSLANPDQFVGKRIFAWNDGNGASQSYAYDELSNQVANATGDSFTYNTEGVIC